MRTPREFWDESVRRAAGAGGSPRPSVFEGSRQASRTFLAMLPEGRQILDFGCGLGRNALALARLGYRVAVADISAEAVRLCRERASREGLSLQRCSYEWGSIGADTESFDGVLAWSVLDHMTLFEGRLVVREFARITRPGGVLLCSFDGEEEGQGILPHEVLADGTIRYTGGEREGMLLRIYQNEEIAVLVEGAWEILDFAGSERTEQRIILCRRRG
ncbi:MAG: class I SAM-dependent methyltransferase [Bacillota bacterium]|nr:class I SAM-dependent methyltransferase [Bacillota bacterium]